MWEIMQAKSGDEKLVDFILRECGFEPFAVTIDTYDGMATIWFKKEGKGGLVELSHLSKEKLLEVLNKQSKPVKGRSRTTVTAGSQ